jgi:uncharacterized lipoprotein YbaY
MIRILLLAALGCRCARGGFRASATRCPSTDTSELTGTVSYRELHRARARHAAARAARGNSRGDAPQFIAETTIPRIGQPPVRFPSPRPAVIDQRSYTLTARIERDEQLLFINDPPMRVLTGGNPSQVEIVVSPAGGRR